MKKKNSAIIKGYGDLVGAITQILEAGRSQAAWSLNSIMSAAYWEIGRRIVEFEQGGQERADYGENVIDQLSVDLKKKYGNGFGRSNLFQIRAFYLAYREKVQTLSGQLVSVSVEKKNSRKIAVSKRASSKVQTLSGQSSITNLQEVIKAFPLSWSQYIRLLTIKDETAREFYETEALRNGWSVRQLDRQIATRFYERTALSKNKVAMLRKNSIAKREDVITPEQAIKDPYILEFLALKDEYSENDLEESLIHRLEDFLMELGGDFTFVGRQKRLRIGSEWYRIDLLFFHRRLRCLVIIDLKVGKFTHADAGQMHLYLNYARERWTLPDENPPVGLILCAEKDAAVAKYSLEGLPNKVMASEYRLALPNEKLLAAEIVRARTHLEKKKR
ncbi:MAG: PDDEXK nuclease domain-containing protein [Verrucomicrobiota bacterium]|nr:PDDEXK nuclease domain-containing protein [Verrucomicrobiota bacterium]